MSFAEWQRKWISTSNNLLPKALTIHMSSLIEWWDTCPISTKFGSGQATTNSLRCATNFPGFYRYALAMEDASHAERERPSRPYDDMVEFSEIHKQLAAQLLATAATLERGYQAMGGGGKVHVVELPVNELAQMHRQWLADLERIKISLRTQGVEPKVLEKVNEGYGRLAKRIEALSTGSSTR